MRCVPPSSMHFATVCSELQHTPTAAPPLPHLDCLQPLPNGAAHALSHVALNEAHVLARQLEVLPDSSSSSKDRSETLA
jgi:hypothetical protein